MLKGVETEGALVVDCKLDAGAFEAYAIFGIALIKGSNSNTTKIAVILLDLASVYMRMDEEF